MERLPREILAIILRQLSLKDYGRILPTAKLFHLNFPHFRYKRSQIILLSKYKRKEIHLFKAIDTAIDHKYSRALECLVESVSNTRQTWFYAATRAILFDNLDILRRILREYPGMTTRFIQYAASYGKLNVIKYLLENHSKSLSTLWMVTIKCAADSGNRDIFDLIVSYVPEEKKINAEKTWERAQIALARSRHRGALAPTQVLLP
jgi:hypothetical protein